MPWTEILGQDAALRQLSKAVARGKISHAYLFHGPRGVGKRTTARIFAQALACQREPLQGGCGECRTCRNILIGSYPDLHWLSSEGSLKLEQTQQLVRQAFIAPQEGACKVFVITEAERLTPEAGNNLLKVLEEPPGDAVFILTTTSLPGVLGTIRSRCQPVGFSPLNDQLIRQLVRERGWATPEQETLVLSMAAGCPGIAREVVQLGGLLAVREQNMALLDGLTGSSAAPELKPEELGRRPLEVRLRVLASLFRDILVWRKTGDSERLVNRDQFAFIQRLADKWGDPHQGLEAVERASRRLAQNANLPLLWEVLLLELAEGRGGSYANGSRSPI